VRIGPDDDRKPLDVRKYTTLESHPLHPLIWNHSAAQLPWLSHLVCVFVFKIPFIPVFAVVRKARVITVINLLGPAACEIGPQNARTPGYPQPCHP